MPEGRDAVFPGDLFPLKIISRKIAYGEFKDSDVESGNLSGDFGLETKSF